MKMTTSVKFNAETYLDDSLDLLESELIKDLSVDDEKLKLRDALKSLSYDDYWLMIIYSNIPSYRKIATIYGTTRFKVNTTINSIQRRIKSRL